MCLRHQTKIKDKQTTTKTTNNKQQKITLNTPLLWIRLTSFVVSGFLCQKLEKQPERNNINSKSKKRNEQHEQGQEEEEEEEEEQEQQEYGQEQQQE